MSEREQIPEVPYSEYLTPGRWRFVTDSSKDIYRSGARFWVSYREGEHQVKYVEGYATEDPVADEDWSDVVRWDVNRNWFDHQDHNQDGFMCSLAGSPECLALGHVVTDEERGEQGDLHEWGWGGDLICPATRTSAACTECESSDCNSDWTPTDTTAFWSLFAAKSTDIQ